MVTITDISKACGVSRATVSKALNGAPDSAPKTAERIREQAKALGYLPNATARALKVGRSYNIGVLFSDTTGGGITHEYFSQIYRRGSSVSSDWYCRSSHSVTSSVRIRREKSS